MKNLFNFDNPVMNFIGKLLDCFLLNILWLLCCIPVITVGASTTALYHCTIKLSKDEPLYLFRDFFHSFKLNFIPAAKLTMIFLVIGIILGIDAYIFLHIKIPMLPWCIGMGLLVLFAICYTITLLYVFVLLSRFDNSIKNMIFNAFAVGIRFIFCTVIIAAIHFIVFYISIRWFAPLMFLGMGLIAFLSSYFLKNVLFYIEESQNKRGTPQ